MLLPFDNPCHGHCTVSFESVRVFQRSLTIAVTEVDNTHSGFRHLNPAGQSLHISLPASPKVVEPSGHRTALCFGDGHMYPMGHSVQFAWPSTEKLPDTQGEIEELGVGQLYPAGQCLQDVAPCW